MKVGTAIPGVRAVCFDIGETIVDKSREYAALARVLGTTPHTFSAVFGAEVMRGGGLASTLVRFGSTAESYDYVGLVATGRVPAPSDDDLFPGVRDLLQRLGEAGLRIGIVGNQPKGYGDRLRALGLPAAIVATSEDWGLTKPSPAFFARVVRELLGADGRPDEVVYIGDQVTADVEGGLAAGLRVVRLRQGPWGRLIHDARAEAQALAIVDAVADVAGVLLR